MTLIKLEDMTDTLEKAGKDLGRPDLLMMIGFITGLVERTPKYVIPDELLNKFAK